MVYISSFINSSDNVSMTKHIRPHSPKQHFCCCKIYNAHKSFVNTEHSLASAMLSQGFPLESEAFCGENNPTWRGTKTSARPTVCAPAGRPQTACIHGLNTAAHGWRSALFFVCFLDNHHKLTLYNYTKKKNNTLSDRNVDAQQHWKKGKTTAITQ